MLKEYDLYQDTMIVYCNNMSVINISRNLVQHNGTKHIDIRHQSIRELVETKVISLEHVQSLVQLVDILTNPLKASLFENLLVGLGACKPTL